MQKNYFYKKSKLILGLIIYLFSISIFAQQQKIVLKGKVTDTFNTPLNETDILLIEKSDSSKISSTVTDDNGFFELIIDIQRKPVYLIINNSQEGTFRKKFEFIKKDVDLGTININSNVYDLSEVVLTSSKPIIIKKDTLEYNADSYKVKPNANMESLFQELPGFEIADDGSILVNGKVVKEILIDGETFFGTDGKVALENLPADVIKKIQVSDFKTRNQKQSAEQSTTNTASINITLKDDMKKGYLLKAIGGYGSDDRYESNLLANYFKGKRRLSLIGSSTNIASSGMVNGEGSHGLKEMERNNNTGITTHTTVGLNYNDQLNKNLKIGVDYRLNHLFNKNDKYIKNENLNPDNVYTTITNSNTRVETYGNNLGTNFDWTKNKTKIYIYPQFSNSSSVNYDLSKSESINTENEVKNSTNSNINRKNNSNNFSNSISIYQKLKNKSYFDFISTITVINKDNNIREISEALFNDDPSNNTYRNVNTKEYEKNNVYNFDLKYIIPISDSINIALGSIYNRSYIEKNNISLNYNDDTGKFDNLNTDLTILFKTKTNLINPYTQFLLNKSKFYTTINLGVNINNQNNIGIYKSVHEKLTQNKVLPQILSSMRYESDNNMFMLIYNYETELPSSNELLKIEDKSSLTSTLIGNPDLKTNQLHDINIILRNFNRKNQQGFSANLHYIYNESSIAKSTITNEDFVREVTYKNVKGNYNLSGFLFYNKQFQKGLNKFRLNIGFSSSYMLNQSFNENIKINTYLTNLSPSIKLNWDYSNILTISPYYKLLYVSSKYKNYPVSGQNNVTHNIGLNTISNFIKRLNWTNHINYNYNSSISSEFKKDFLLWNSSIMYRFFNDKLEAGIKIYDILKQNNNFTRIISDQYISDEKNSILTQFIMFSLTFNLNKFGQKISDKNEYLPKENDDFSEKILSLND